MSISIAQTRQQLASLIDAAQSTPQVITKRNTPVAVLVSAEYFKRTESAAHSAASFYNTLTALREAHPPTDDVGLPSIGAGRASDWSRANRFADSH